MPKDDDESVPTAQDLSPIRRRTISRLEQAGRGRLPEDTELIETARQLMKARAAVAAYLPENLMRDSAWDVMLELFVNGEEGGLVFVKHLILATGQAPATAIRVIDRLEGADLLKRYRDPLDHRRIIVAVTDQGRDAMRAVLRKLSELRFLNVEPNAFQPKRGTGEA
jgi:DNA-binding MarR family transcriptional regulator